MDVGWAAKNEQQDKGTPTHILGKSESSLGCEYEFLLVP